VVNKDEILERLKNIVDPELEVNIVDLGLIYDIIIDEKECKISVAMTLTAEGCPLSNVIKFEAEEALKGLSGTQKAEVNIVWEPKWNPSMIKPEALSKLKRH
jgi:metal-sulfur cluster biosynthetic enzyme